MKNRQHIIIQNGIYLIIWLILFLIPVFGYRDDEGIRFDAVVLFWARMLPFLLLFVLNNYILIPRLLVPRRYGRYLAMVALSISAILILNHLVVRTYLFPSPKFRSEKGKSVTVAKPNGDTLLVTVIDNGELLAAADSSTSMAIATTAPPTKSTENQVREQKRNHHFRAATWQYLMMDYIVSILLVGTNAAICLMFLSLADRERLQKMESQSLKSELDYLKSQINPHFFMNTLNNIHALVDIDSERAKESIIELSKIMRYVLYDTNLPLVPLKKEVEFIDNFIQLMRMRYSDEVRISTRYPDPLPDVKLPPLLMMALIENAFKHGISYQRDSFVSLSVDVVGDDLICTVENSFFADKVVDLATSGVGLTNLVKRLELLFGDRGKLAVNEQNDRYTTTLILPLR